MVRRSAGFVSKKAHTKSKSGCLTCKRKKVKCDETQPICSYCLPRNLKCEYLHNADSALELFSSSSSPAPSSRTSLLDEEIDFNDMSLQIPTWLVPPASTASGQMSFLDHELLHHYKTSTWWPLAIREDAIVNSLHRDFIPQFSLSHSHLLYALLSSAASHRNSLCPSKEMETQALVYRQKTFHEYSKALQNITAENYEAVLMTGMFLVAMVPQPGPEGSDEEYLDWMFSLLKMSEGLRILASLRWGQGIEKLRVYPLICRELRTLPPSPIVHDVPDANLFTPLGPLGSTPGRPNPAPTYQRQTPLSTPVFLPPSLMVLFESLANPPTTGPMDLDCNSIIPAFRALSPIFLSLYYYHLNQDFYVRVFVFSSFLMPEFLALVKTREPRALTLVAWWYALAGHVPRRWWFGGCVSRVVRILGRVVRMSGDLHTVEAIKGAERIVETFERAGVEEAAKTIFEGWEGMDWEEGPRKAEEWELGQLLDLDGLDGLDL